MLPRRVALVFVTLFVACQILITPSQAQSPAPPFTGTVLENARIRSGPGTNHAIAGGLQAGAKVRITGCNPACDWYTLESGGWVAAFLIGPSLAEAPAPSLPAVPAGAVDAQVVRITDGDTIRVSFAGGTNLALRYIGIDTPETDEAFFQEAAAYNEQLILGQTVYLETDVSETDRYGRLLRHVWLADGRLVSEELVAAGLAVASTYPPDVKYQARFLDAERVARGAGLGFWATNAAPASAARVAAVLGPAAPACTTAANLRAGPGTEYAVVGLCPPGQTLAVTGQNADGSWLQLSSGAWVFSSLVDAVPGTLAVVAVAPLSAPAPAVVETTVPVPAPAPQGNCDASYPTVCIPPRPPDLDCGQISYRRFQVQGADPHDFDRDRDGVGCESD